MKPRPRRADECARDWLMSKEDQRVCGFGLGGCMVKCPISPSTEVDFDARFPPLLPGWFSNNVHLGPAEPVTINAPLAVVWQQVLEFDSYKEFNPFHRHVEVLEDTGTGKRYMSLHVALMNPQSGVLPPHQSCFVGDKERVFYVDERDECCILLYGLDGMAVPTIRGQVLIKTSPSTCEYYSYDLLGGSLAGVVNWLLGRSLQRGFELSAQALKLRCEEKVSLAKL
ncbi:hypothetical protein BASA81_003115 [Batrachochytrium salamandrivorans]|nr:hypothetical protein BASA81_003115 [Batrachochytrium salamandrivorans]